MARLLLALLLLGVCGPSGVRSQACLPPCTKCYADGACEVCTQEGTLLYQGRCMECADPLCMQCGPTPDTCIQCAQLESDLLGPVWPNRPVYLSSTGACTACAAHPTRTGCMACNRRGACTRCREGFVLVDGACKQCLGGGACAACSADSLQCTGCKAGYGLNSGKQCVPCATAACGNCSADYRICTKCATDRRYLAGNQCKLCLADYCGQCKPDGSCQRCLSDGDQGGYVMVAGTCRECGVYQCKRCSAPGRCAECQPGNYPSAWGTCDSCDPYCAKCSGPGQCTECASLSLIPSGGGGASCQRCDDPRCADCTGDAAACLRCKDPANFAVNAQTKRCTLLPPSARTAAAQAAGPQLPRRALAANNSSALAGVAAAGEDAGAAVIGGRNAERGRYPYMTSLRLNHVHKQFPHVCGASLIHQRFLITAAHCMVTTGNEWRDPTWTFPQVRIGGYELVGGAYEQRQGKWAVVHPLYVNDRNDHDVAIILLDRPSRQRPFLQLPSSTPRPAAKAGAMLTALGWGYTDTRQTSPTVLQEVQMPMVPLDTCAQKYYGEDWSSQLCAGDPKRTDTCQGDSGGPLFIKGDTAADDILVGLTSWGNGCAQGFPGVYADAAWARGWVVETMKWLLAEERAGRIPPVAPPVS